MVSSCFAASSLSFSISRACSESLDRSGQGRRTPEGSRKPPSPPRHPVPIWPPFPMHTCPPSPCPPGLQRHLLGIPASLQLQKFSHFVPHVAVRAWGTSRLPPQGRVQVHTGCVQTPGCSGCIHSHVGKAPVMAAPG